MANDLHEPAAAAADQHTGDWCAAHPSRGLQLGLGALLITVGAAADISGLSRELMQAVHGGHALWHDAWAALTLLGFGWPLLILAAVFAGARGTPASVLLKAALLAMVFAQLPKALLQRPRPALVLDPSELSIVGDAVLHTASMPSGHALAAFALVAAAWCGCRDHLGGPWSWRQRLGWGSAWGLASAVAWSRVAVGAHWPSDVLVGAGLGLWVGVLAWRWEMRWPWGAWFESPRGRWAVPAFLTVSALAWGLTRTGYPSAAWLQAALVALALIEACRQFWQRSQMTASAQGQAASLQRRSQR